MSWKEWKAHVLEELRQQREDHKKVMGLLLSIREDVGRTGGRSAALGGVVSACVAALVAAMVAGLMGCAPPPNTPAPGEHLFDPVVALVSSSGRPYCSGTLLEIGILTAAHCISAGHEGDPILVGLRPDLDRRTGRWTRARPVRLLRLDRGLDLALLSRGPSWAPRARVRRLPARVGEPVVAVGHPFRMPYVQQRGHVSSEVRTGGGGGDGRAWFGIDVGVMPGMSGGPVFDAHGLVLGVVSFYVGSAHLGGVLPARLVFAMAPWEPPEEQG